MKLPEYINLGTIWFTKRKQRIHCAALLKKNLNDEQMSQITIVEKLPPLYIEKAIKEHHRQQPDNEEISKLSVENFKEYYVCVEVSLWRKK